MVHSLKTLHCYFQRTWDMQKQFEVRNNDRGFQAGDGIVLLEWNGAAFTGRRIECTVKYVLTDFIGLANGYVALGLEINHRIN